jgi:hypothetical protein
VTDYATRLDTAHRRLDDLDTFNITRVPQAESLAPLWFSTAEALTIWDAA